MEDVNKTYILENVANSTFLGMTLANYTASTYKLKGRKFGERLLQLIQISVVDLSAIYRYKDWNTWNFNFAVVYVAMRLVPRIYSGCDQEQGIQEIFLPKPEDATEGRGGQIN